MTFDSLRPRQLPLTPLGEARRAPWWPAMTFVWRTCWGWWARAKTTTTTTGARKKVLKFGVISRIKWWIVKRRYRSSYHRWKKFLVIIMYGFQPQPRAPVISPRLMYLACERQVLIENPWDDINFLPDTVRSCIRLTIGVHCDGVCAVGSWPHWTWMRTRCCRGWDYCRCCGDCCCAAAAGGGRTLRSFDGSRMTFGPAGIDF